MNTAPNLVLVGPMGAGKTALGRRLAERRGLRFVDLDAEIERRAGATVAMIFQHDGEAGFRRRERALLAELLDGAGQLIATGGGAVLDADSRARMRERGFVVWLKVGIDDQLARLARDRTRPLLAGDDRVQVLHRLAAERGPLYAECAHLEFAPLHPTPRDAAAALDEALAAHWQPPAPHARPAA